MSALSEYLQSVVDRVEADNKANYIFWYSEDVPTLLEMIYKMKNDLEAISTYHALGEPEDKNKLTKHTSDLAKKCLEECQRIIAGRY